MEIAEKDFKKLDIPLVRISGHATIASTPEGAEVLRNGKSVGKTPFNLEGWDGDTVECILRMDGFQDKTVPVSLKENGETQTFALDAKPKTEPGQLTKAQPAPSKVPLNLPATPVAGGPKTPQEAMAEVLAVARVTPFENWPSKKNEILTEGQIVYIEKKKQTGIRDTYIVQSNDTWYSISQFTGVQLKSLKEINKITIDSIPTPGKVLNLKSVDKRTFFQKLFGKKQI